jgi:SAM-dependent MidA family methyltransferase
VEMTESGLREVHIDVTLEALALRLGPPSTPRLAAYLADAGVTLEPGWRAEVNLAAVDWVGQVAGRLRRGYLLLVDYGYEAAELYSSTRARGTLSAFQRHLADPPALEGPAVPAWLAEPGRRDLTSHIDLTSIRRAAARAGLEPICTVSQTRFLLDILERGTLMDELSDPERVKDRLAIKTLLVPGGPGSTHQAMLFAKR